MDFAFRSSSRIDVLHIDPFNIMTAEVPARGVAEVRKQGVDAKLVLWREEHKLGFAALQADRIVAPHFHGAELSAVVGDPVPNREIVPDVQKAQRQKCEHDDAFHA
jgi:hypothetical protein